MNCSLRRNQWTLKQGDLQGNSIGYMPGLDGLRALAVFSVIAYHLNLSWAPGGLLGVSLFFVLSGYLITNILLNQWELSGTINLKEFWIRRVRRLMPALFFMLAGVMAWIALCAPERIAAVKQEVLAAVLYISNWYLILHHVSYFERFGPPSPLGHLWSLAVEEQFYLFWPLLLGLGLRFFPQRKWVIGGTVAAALLSVMAMALIYIPGQDPSRVYYGTDTRAFALLSGALLAMVWPSRKMDADLSGKKKLVLDAAGCGGLMIVIMMIVKTNQYQTFLYQGGLFLYSIAAAFLVGALAHPASRLASVFSWKPFRWLGECSYGIYLWHYPVIVLTSPVVDTEGTNLLRSLWQVGASVILAAISRYLIEEPIRYGRRRTSIRRKWSVVHRRRRNLDLGIKFMVGVVLAVLLLFVTGREVIQTSAKDLATPASVKQIQAEEKGSSQTADLNNQLNGEKNQGDKRADKEDSKDTKEPSPADKDGIKGEEITAIGDSLMLDVEPVLQEKLPGIVVDGQIGRQMHQAPDVISGLKKEGKLGSVVIIELGTNGSFTAKQLTEALETLDGTKKILIVNTRVPRPWESVVNETLEEVLQSYPEVKLVDWYSASSGHDDYFYPDGVHLNKAGAEAYGKLIADTLTSDESRKQQTCYNSK